MFELVRYQKELFIYMKTPNDSEKAELDRTVRKINRNKSLEAVVEYDVPPLTAVTGATFEGLDSAVLLQAKPGENYDTPKFKRMQENAVRKVLDAVSGPAGVFDAMTLLYARDLEVERTL